MHSEEDGLHIGRVAQSFRGFAIVVKLGTIWKEGYRGRKFNSVDVGRKRYLWSYACNLTSIIGRSQNSTQVLVQFLCGAWPEDTNSSRSRPPQMQLVADAALRGLSQTKLLYHSRMAKWASYRASGAQAKGLCDVG